MKTGILTQAQTAKEENRAASVKEAIDLWKMNKKADELAGTSTAETEAELLNNLKEQGLITPDEYTILSSGGTITIGSREITVAEPAKTLVQAFLDGDLEVGDYVNYTPVVGTTTTVTKPETGYGEAQTYTVADNTNWQVLGLSEDGNNLLLTSTSPVARDGEEPYLVLSGAESYVMCEWTLDKICSIYKNDYAKEARSMKAEDINRILGKEITIEEREYEYKAGDYVPENYVRDMYLANENVDEKIKTYIEENVEAKSIGDKVANTYYNYSITNDNIEETIYNMLFSGTTAAENNAKSYWLASPGAYAFPGAYAYFGPGYVYDGYVGSGFGLFYSLGFWYAFEFGVRPVIVLNSEVTVKDIQEITASELKTEVEWTANAVNVESGMLTGTEGKLVEEAAAE